MAVPEQRIELPPRPSSAAEARRFVAAVLHEADDTTREIGVLLVSELVTNALLYAPGSITVRVVETTSAFRILVHDASDREVRPRQVGPDATSGRGLALVDRLSEEWGVVQVGDDGKEVWFEVPRSA